MIFYIYFFFDLYYSPGQIADVLTKSLVPTYKLELLLICQVSHSYIASICFVLVF